MATLHLIHGFVGAGKTTFAKKLEADNHMVRFTCDEWMILLFGNNPPVNFFTEYENKIKDLIWSEAKKFLQLGHDVVLDFGFWKKAEREHYRKIAQDIGIEVKLYNLQCPEEIMVKRVLERTSAMQPNAFLIDENALHEFKSRIEPVDPATEDSIVIYSY